MAWEDDPFLKDKRVYDGPVPPDFSERHDDYLFEELERDLYKEDAQVKPEWPDLDQD